MKKIKQALHHNKTGTTAAPLQEERHVGEERHDGMITKKEEVIKRGPNFEEIDIKEVTVPEHPIVYHQPSFVEQTVIKEDIPLGAINTRELPGTTIVSGTSLPGTTLPITNPCHHEGAVETTSKGALPLNPTEVVTTVREIYQVVPPGGAVVHAPDVHLDSFSAAEEVTTTTRLVREEWVGQAPPPGRTLDTQTHIPYSEKKVI